MIKEAYRGLLSCCLFVCAISTISSIYASQKRLETAQHGAWTVRCEPNTDHEHATCFMFQQLVEKKAGKPVLQLSIGLTPPNNTPSLLMSLPLGISLIPGILLQIDDGPVTRFPVERCEPEGCRAAAKIRKETINQMKVGDFLNVTFHDGNREPITVQVSLALFAESYSILQQEETALY